MDGSTSGLAVLGGASRLCTTAEVGLRATKLSEVCWWNDGLSGHVVGLFQFGSWSHHQLGRATKVLALRRSLSSSVEFGASRKWAIQDRPTVRVRQTLAVR